MGIIPADWAASTAISAPFRWARLHSRSTGRRKPNTLEQWVARIMRVFGRMASAKALTVASSFPGTVATISKLIRPSWAMR